MEVRRVTPSTGASSSGGEVVFAGQYLLSQLKQIEAKLDQSGIPELRELKDTLSLIRSAEKQIFVIFSYLNILIPVVNKELGTQLEPLEESLLQAVFYKLKVKTPINPADLKMKEGDNEDDRRAKFVCQLLQDVVAEITKALSTHSRGHSSPVLGPPLSSVVLSSQVEERELSEADQRKMGEIQQTAFELERAINDLFTVDGLQQGDFQLLLARIDSLQLDVEDYETRTKRPFHRDWKSGFLAHIERIRRAFDHLTKRGEAPAVFEAPVSLFAIDPTAVLREEELLKQKIDELFANTYDLIRDLQNKKVTSDVAKRNLERFKTPFNDLKVNPLNFKLFYPYNLLKQNIELQIPFLINLVELREKMELLDKNDLSGSSELLIQILDLKEECLNSTLSDINHENLDREIQDLFNEIWHFFSSAIESKIEQIKSEYSEDSREAEDQLITLQAQVESVISACSRRDLILSGDFLVKMMDGAFFLLQTVVESKYEIRNKSIKTKIDLLDRKALDFVTKAVVLMKQIFENLKEIRQFSVKYPQLLVCRESLQDIKREIIESIIQKIDTQLVEIDENRAKWQQAEVQRHIGLVGNDIDKLKEIFSKNVLEIGSGLSPTTLEDLDEHLNALCIAQ